MTNGGPIFPFRCCHRSILADGGALVTSPAGSGYLVGGEEGEGDDGPWGRDGVAPSLIPTRRAVGL